MEINQEYTSTNQVLRKLRFTRIFIIIIILLNICAIISLASYFSSLTIGKHQLVDDFSAASFVFRVLLFFINAVVIIYYYQMVPFFIELIQEDQKEAKKFKLSIWLLIIIITFTICLENLLFPIWSFLRYTLDVNVTD